MSSALAIALLLPFALLDRAAAARRVMTYAVSEEHRTLPLYDHSERWCLTSEAAMTCDEGTVLDVFSAFTSTAWRRCGPPARGGDHVCDGPNITDWVRSLCNGQHSCAVPPSPHPECEPRQHSVRIAWSCVASLGVAGAEDPPAHVAVALRTREEASGEDEEDQQEAAADTPATTAAGASGDDEEEDEMEEAEDKVEEEEEVESELPGCPASVEAETQQRKGHLTTICRDIATGQFAKKACCEDTIAVKKRASEACLAVRQEHCKPDLQAFKNKKQKYPDVPEGFLCRRKYHCMKGNKVMGIAASAAVCGSHRLSGRKVCAAEEE